MAVMSPVMTNVSGGSILHASPAVGFTQNSPLPSLKDAIVVSRVLGKQFLNRHAKVGSFIFVAVSSIAASIVELRKSL